VLVERYIRAREVHVGILGDRVLGAIEVVPKRPFYDYEAKYSKGLCEYYFPARLAPTRYQGVLRLAERAHHALGCTGATRVNVLVTEGENEYVLEVNTLPGHDRQLAPPQDRRGRRASTSPPSARRSSSGARLHSRAGEDRSVAREADAAAVSRDLGDA
jgi:D-alanine-D-alanine ligase-like ATP-grasp enzyme